jgi:hypothetical protein
VGSLKRAGVQEQCTNIRSTKNNTGVEIVKMNGATLHSVSPDVEVGSFVSTTGWGTLSVYVVIV